MSIFSKMQRLVRRMREVAKNAPRTGKSARRGNARSPYQKYEKSEYRYSPSYYTWRQKVTGKATRERVGA